MPATQFICPDGRRILIQECLTACPRKQRCMFLPTLRAVANSLNRGITEPTVTELIAGTRETYLKKTINYAVNPQDVLYALHGQAVHTINEGHTEGNILTEVRLTDAITSGKFDLYGEILDQDSGVLGDIKVTSSYKLMKALGKYKVDVPTGEVYKTGARKGEPKYKKEWRDDGVKAITDWAIQLNYYRILLEQQGLVVNKMIIQAMCRDNSLRIANERGIYQAIYLIPIQKISDQWLNLYFKAKAFVLQQALNNNRLPAICKPRERWYDRKCLDYCQVASHCQYGIELAQRYKQPLPGAG
ncbi:hypothetical protein SOV_52420 [Sporomusa ovata DSM 2662]|uniref:PD-(D/E)XK endonuclease-like domain-containing protein n=1 Tax=Sporomusa ovata TaxID=2378 RepID=A0A0U1KRC7_9FIRM|nr:hypothetical protein [Sporomusa ovata]EQB27614.1 hypothetical protein SOV_2c05110 [Sporomusa ovata DSM 2662]CQR69966.1 hypothetical protein SpAn4DRAFT_4831 [Sporomusa ovata]